MDVVNPPEINQALVFGELFSNEIIYVADNNFKIVFVSKGAKDLYQMLTNAKDEPIGKTCYKAFKMRKTRCENCLMNLYHDSKDKDFILEPLGIENEMPKIKMAYKLYIKNDNIYIIHHLIKYELLDIMEGYSQKIIDNSKEAIIVTDLNGIIVSVNPTFEQKMGYREEEVICKPNEIFYEDELEANKITNIINTTGRIENYRTKVMTKAGKIRDIELSGWIVNKGGAKVIVRVSKFLEKAQVLKSVIAITENILKAYEPERLTYYIVNETAQLLESKFCCLYLVSDDNSKLVLGAASNPKFMQQAKDIQYDLNWNARTDDEIDGITSWIAIRRTPFQANSWNEIMKHPSHKGKLDKVYSDSGMEFKNMYAIPLIIEDKVRGVFRIENKIDGDIYINVDKEIFELMGTYIMLVLEEQNRLKKTVLEHIAHMVRSPIAEAVMNLSLLDPANFSKLSKYEITESIRIIKNALLQANMTVTNLIMWSTESKAIYNVTNKVRINGLVLKLIHSFEAYISNIRFNVNVSGDLALTIPAQIKLEIILQNVIHNSIKYSKHDRPVESIDIIGRIEGNYYKIRVRDYGIGMHKNDLKIVFKEFTKGESSRWDRERFGSVRGLGIGLASVKKVCNEMKWKYDLQSELGRGTTFTLKIPLEGDQDGA